MLVPKLLGFFNPVPRTIYHTYPSFLDMLHILFLYILFCECRQDYPSEFLLFVFYFGQQLEPLQFLACTFFAVAVLKINHEKRDSLLGLWNDFPLAIYVLLLILFLGVLLSELKLAKPFCWHFLFLLHFMVNIIIMQDRSLSAKLYGFDVNSGLGVRITGVGVDILAEHESEFVDKVPKFPMKADNSIVVGQGYNAIDSSASTIERRFLSCIGYQHKAIDKAPIPVLYLTNILIGRYFENPVSSPLTSICRRVCRLDPIRHHHLQSIDPIPTSHPHLFDHRQRSWQHEAEWNSYVAADCLVLHYLYSRGRGLWQIWSWLLAPHFGAVDTQG